MKVLSVFVLFFIAITHAQLSTIDITGATSTDVSIKGFVDNDVGEFYFYNILISPPVLQIGTILRNCTIQSLLAATTFTNPNFTKTLDYNYLVNSCNASRTAAISSNSTYIKFTLSVVKYTCSEKPVNSTNVQGWTCDSGTSFLLGVNSMVSTTITVSLTTTNINGVLAITASYYATKTADTSVALTSTLGRCLDTTGTILITDGSYALLCIEQTISDSSIRLSFDCSGSAGITANNLELRVVSSISRLVAYQPCFIPAFIPAPAPVLAATLTPINGIWKSVIRFYAVITSTDITGICNTTTLCNIAISSTVGSLRQILGRGSKKLMAAETSVTSSSEKMSLSIKLVQQSPPVAEPMCGYGCSIIVGVLSALCFVGMLYFGYTMVVKYMYSNVAQGASSVNLAAVATDKI
jgi:hypothetical protein